MRAFFMFTLLMVLPAIGLSDTINVPADYATIQEAIVAAENGDSVLVAPGTYVENLDFLNKEIKVQSTGGPESTVIDGGHPSNPFQGSVVKLIGEGPEALLEGFTLKNGYGSKIGADPFFKGGGIICLSSSATIRNNILVKNSVSPGHGGGIYVAYGSPTIEGNIIAECSADGVPGCGGGIYIHTDSSMSETIHVKNNDLSWNDAADYGGGICVEGTEGNPHWPDLVVVKGNIISGNDSEKTGGGIYCFNHASPRILENTVFLNRAMEGGGGIMLSYHAQPEIDGNCICENDGDWGGGGAWGGGIRCDSFSAPEIRNNMIVENTAGEGGGVVCVVGSNPSIINNTITGNVASGMGGGISINNGCTVAVWNTIIWDNDADSGIEILLENFCSLSIDYSDVEGGQSSVFFDAHSLVNWGSAMIGDDPLFADAANRDFHLTYNSPCRDTGDNSMVTELCDFEGDPRIVWGGTVDMGADEFYTHLYITGDQTPGGVIQGKFVGLPGTSPVRLFIGLGGVRPTPLPTIYGDLWLLPPRLSIPLVPIPSNGILVISTTVPLLPSAPYDIPMQALIGLNSDSLTNLCVLEVR